MPITKSAQKAHRQGLKRKARNMEVKKKIKKLLKEVRFLSAKKKTEEAKALLPKIYQTLDKAAKTGQLKKGTADRLKSRLAKLIKRSES